MGDPSDLLKGLNDGLAPVTGSGTHTLLDEINGAKRDAFDISQPNPKFVENQQRLNDEVNTFIKGEEKEGIAQRTLGALPVFGFAHKTFKAFEFNNAMERIQNNKAEENDFLIAGRFIAQQKDISERGFIEKTFDIGVQIPGIALEFMATGGLAVGARIAAQKAGEKIIGKTISAAVRKQTSRFLGQGAFRAVIGKGVAGTAELGFRVAFNPQHVLFHTANRMRDEFSLQGDTEGKLKVIIGDKGEKFWEAFPKGLADQTIEILSELAGGPLQRIPGMKSLGNTLNRATGAAGGAVKRLGTAVGAGVINKIPQSMKLKLVKTGIIKRWLARHPAKGLDDLSREIASASGWHGPVTEFFEERLGEIARGATGLREEFGATGDLFSGNYKKFLEQAAMEGLAFAMIPGAKNIIGQIPGGINFLDAVTLRGPDGSWKREDLITPGGAREFSQTNPEAAQKIAEGGKLSRSQMQNLTAVEQGTSAEERDAFQDMIRGELWAADLPGGQPTKEQKAQREIQIQEEEAIARGERAERVVTEEQKARSATEEDLAGAQTELVANLKAEEKALEEFTDGAQPGSEEFNTAIDRLVEVQDEISQAEEELGRRGEKAIEKVSAKELSRRARAVGIAPQQKGVKQEEIRRQVIEAEKARGRAEPVEEVAEEVVEEIEDLTALGKEELLERANKARETLGLKKVGKNRTQAFLAADVAEKEPAAAAKEAPRPVRKKAKVVGRVTLPAEEALTAPVSSAIQSLEAVIEDERPGTSTFKEAVARAVTRLKETPGFGSQNKFVNRAGLEEAKAKLRGEGQLGSGIDIDSLIKVGTFWVEAGVRKFSTWVAIMKDELGPVANVQLKIAWDRISVKAPGKDGTGVLAPGQVGEDVEAFTDRLREIFETQEPLVRKPFIMGIEELLNEVFEDANGIAIFGSFLEQNPNHPSSGLIKRMMERLANGELSKVQRVQEFERLLTEVTGRHITFGTDQQDHIMFLIRHKFTDFPEFSLAFTNGTPGAAAELLTKFLEESTGPMPQEFRGLILKMMTNSSDFKTLRDFLKKELGKVLVVEGTARIKSAGLLETTDSDLGSQNTIITKQVKDEAVRRFRGEGQLGSGFDIDSAIKIGAFYIEAGIRNFPAFSEIMRKELGPVTQAKMQEIFNKSKALIPDKPKGDVRAPSRPDLANPGETEFTRNLIDDVDAIRNAAGDPKKITLDNVHQAALAEIEKNGIDSEQPRLTEKIRSDETLTGIDVLIAKRIINLKGLSTLGDPKKRGELMRFVDDYRESGRAQAIAFKIRGTQLETEGEANIRALIEALLAPPSDKATKIDKLKKQGKTKEAQKVLDEWNNDLTKLLADLKNNGFDIQGEEGLSEKKITEILEDNEKSNEMLRIIQSFKSTFGDKAFEIWNNNILMGALTHAKNIAGNVGHAVYEFALSRPIQAVINKFTGDMTGPQLGEFKHALNGFTPGITRAMRNAVVAWKTESSGLSVELGRKTTLGQKFDRKGIAIRGKFGRIIRAPGWRALLASDDAFKSLIATMDANAKAFRIAKQEGLSGLEMETRIRELVEDLNSRAWTEAFDAAVDLAFQKDVGRVGKWILETRTRFKPLQWFVPFVTTPENILKRGLEISPLGTPMFLVEIAKSSQTGVWTKTSRLAAQQMIAYAIIMAMWDNDPEDPWITGSEDQFKKGRRELGRRTFPSQSVRFWGKEWSYAGLEPFATGLSIMVDWTNRLKRGENVDLNDLVSLVKDKTYLRGISDLIEITLNTRGSRSESAAKWASNFTASWVPNLIKGTVRAGQDEFKERRIWGDGLEFFERAGRRAIQKMEFGIISDQPSIDLWGRVSKREAPTSGNLDILGINAAPATDFMARLLLPVKIFRKEILIGDRVLINWNAAHPDDRKEPAQPLPSYTKDDERISMSDQEFTDFLKLSGTVARHITNSELTEKGADSPTELDIRIIERALKAGRDEAKKILFGIKGGSRFKDDTPKQIADAFVRKHRLAAFKALRARPSRRKRGQTLGEFLELRKKSVIRKKRAVAATKRFRSIRKVN